ncbi:MAG: hypothetical protein ABJC33_12650, partial [Betaproteobacteria bacterium]
MPRVVIGIVGYYQFVRGYPLGPELMARLRSIPWPEGIEIREMNWGPIAIVQDFEAGGVTYDRVVLVGAADRGLARGTVSARRWLGGALEPLAVQQRVFEAVTGIISLDNLLVIGAHFGVWPAEVITIEAQLGESSLSDLVLGEIEVDREAGHMAIIGEKPLTPDHARMVDSIVELTRRAALGGAQDL